MGGDRHLRRPRRAHAQGGFTLIELLMGLVLASIFAIALFSFFFAGVDRVRSQESQARAQMTGRTAIDRLVRDARQAISPDDGLTPPVIALSPTTLEMYVDPSRATSSVVPRPERVRYAIVADQLIREFAVPVGVTAPFTYGSYRGREVLIERLVNGATPAFRGVTAEGVLMSATPAPTQLRDIAQISVRLLISQRTGNAATTLELNTDVALRNAVRL
jgi:prepilin-type N-terminal cleavage/methylation domain-containing protein